jgi:hypothetical protein
MGVGILIRFLSSACAGAWLLASGSSALAENISDVKAGGFKTAFSLCPDVASGQACSQETWTIKILADGWELEAVSVSEGTTFQWGEKCRSGQYDFHGEGIDWSGTCKLRGTRADLCFAADIRTTPGSELKMASVNEQCVAIASPTTCTMRMIAHNAITNFDGTVEEYLATEGNVTECTVMTAP